MLCYVMYDCMILANIDNASSVSVSRSLLSLLTTEYEDKVLAMFAWLCVVFSQIPPGVSFRLITTVMPW